MKIYDITESIELSESNIDLKKGRLELRTKTEIIPAVQKVEEQGHYEVVQVFPNGGRDMKWVVDVQGVEAVEEQELKIDYYVYIPYTEEELNIIAKNEIRMQRAAECFPIINRGQLWYNTLTDEQKTELGEWYTAWLNAPQTNYIPEKPSWLN